MGGTSPDSPSVRMRHRYSLSDQDMRIAFLRDQTCVYTSRIVASPMCQQLAGLVVNTVYVTLTHEGLPNREGPKLGQIGDGRSAGVPLGLLLPQARGPF